VSFLAPERLWLLLLVPVLLLGYLLVQRRSRRHAVAFSNSALLASVSKSRLRWRQHLAAVLAIATLAAAIVVFAKPSGTSTIPRRSSVTVVLTIDVSLSMSASDLLPSRIAAAKRTASQFVRRLPSDYKVAVVSFAQHADVVVAPTTRRSAIYAGIDGLGLKEYTATGDGIFAALGVAKQSLAPTMIVLLSDGARTVGRSQVVAARTAKRQGVPIYTVALGDAGTTITANGQTLPVPVALGQLRQIARISGGKSYTAATVQDLAGAYRDVTGTVLYERVPVDAAGEYLGFLLVLALLSALAGLSVTARWP
jgi:Ca-activated chloride channel family protein